MASKAVSRSVSVSVRRCLSSKSHPENVILADALNLLSPSEAGPKPASTFKPSILSNFANGPATEQYKLDDIMSVKLPSAENHENTAEMYVNNLLMGLQSSNIIHTTPNFQVLEMSPKELSTHIKTINSEKRLLELIEIFYYQNRLTPRLLTDIVLNKHLKNLASPKLASIGINLLELKTSKLNWSPLNYIQFDIILLKKFHDLKKPLLIIKNLKENFNSKYFPLVESKSLTPFYERIVWKFNFEYIKNFDELYYIKKLNFLKSSFLIWESSLHNNYKISQFVLETFPQMNKIQKLFLTIASNELVQNKINEQLEVHLNSKVLSTLKKISIKYKIYDMDDSPTNENRIAYYSLISSLEELVNELPEDASIAQIRKDLNSYREEYLMKLNLVHEESKWLNEQFVELTKG